jgi:PhzF family phenazine biosynthesis protein
MTIPLYVVDAFTASQFCGNPAAVCPLESWLPDSLMQNIAAENNLAETAFTVPEGARWGLRWFTPTVEIDLCGHATLASSFVLAGQRPGQHEFRFNTRSGELCVTRREQVFTLDFPARSLQTLALEPELRAALRIPVLSVTSAARTLIAELENEAAVQRLKPDFSRILSLDCHGLIVTARGGTCDFVSRFFAPKVGIDEDPVTGSAHCGLVPFWAQRLGKTTLVARQLSARGGELHCELKGDRVLMGGQAVLFSSGVIHLA